jgi:hypothetical protein
MKSQIKNTGIGVIAFIIIIAFDGCKNRDINEGEQFKPREIHEDIMFSFDKITVDGIEYLILEKDNNNPHEGFGFMALRGNKLMEKTDTILAYLKTIRELQAKNYAMNSKKPVDVAIAESDAILLYHLNEQQADFERLEKSELRSVKE